MKKYYEFNVSKEWSKLSNCYFGCDSESTLCTFCGLAVQSGLSVSLSLSFDLDLIIEGTRDWLICYFHIVLNIAVVLLFSEVALVLWLRLTSVVLSTWVSLLCCCDRHRSSGLEIALLLDDNELWATFWQIWGVHSAECLGSLSEAAFVVNRISSVALAACHHVSDVARQIYELVIVELVVVKALFHRWPHIGRSCFSEDMFIQT